MNIYFPVLLPILYWQLPYVINSRYEPWRKNLQLWQQLRFFQSEIAQKWNATHRPGGNCKTITLQCRVSTYLKYIQNVKTFNTTLQFEPDQDFKKTSAAELASFYEVYSVTQSLLRKYMLLQQIVLLLCCFDNYSLWEIIPTNEHRVILLALHLFYFSP